MENQKVITFTPETTLTPVCYKDFQCLAASCQDTCCRNWTVSFDQKDYLSLRNLDVPAEIRGKLDAAMVRLQGDQAELVPDMYAKFRLNEAGACPMLTAEGFCSIQRACGHEALPHVCQTFPRRVSFTTAARELALSPGCEGVLALLWDHPEGLDFAEDLLDEKDRQELAIDMGTPNLMPWFAPIRSLCVDILQNRALPFSRRMLLLGLAVRELMELDWEQPDLEGWDRCFAPLTTGDQATELLASVKGNHLLFLRHNLTLANSVGNVSWARDVLRAMGAKGTPGTKMTAQPELYAVHKSAFDTAFGDIEWFFENLTVAAAWFYDFPDLSSRESLWKNYEDLCILYSMYRFAAVAASGTPPTRKDLFHTLVGVSRSILHNKKWRSEIRQYLDVQDSSSLAAMAILLGE